MSNPTIPSDMEHIFTKPGYVWTPEERKCVTVWLHEPQQQGKIQEVAQNTLKRYRSPAVIEIAEYMWNDYYVKGKLDERMSTYKPDGGRTFWNYLVYWGNNPDPKKRNHGSFQHHCYIEGEKKAKEVIRNPQPQGYFDGEEFIEFEFIDESMEGNPEETFKQKQIYDILQDCINKLKPIFREVIILHYFEYHPVAEISKTINKGVNNTKVLLYRARQMLAQCILTKVRLHGAEHLLAQLLGKEEI